MNADKTIGRIATFALPAAAAALLIAFVAEYLHFYLPWSAPRLAASLGMLHGYPLYSPTETGVINGWIYGPVSALLWLPAGFASTPAGALRAAVAIDFAVLFTPLWFVAHREARNVSFSWQPAACATIAAAIFALFHPTLDYMATELCSDTPAVAFATISCICLTSRRQPAGAVWAAAMIALAVWSKLLVLPVVAAQVVFVAVTSGWRPAVRHALAATLWIAVLGVAFVAAWGFEPIAFNMWQVPFRHLLASGSLDYLREFGRFFLYTSPLWIVILIARLGSGARQPLRSDDCAALLVIVALFSLPGCIVATLKVGGDANSLHPVYYALAAAVAVVPGLISKHRSVGIAVPALITIAMVPIGVDACGKISLYFQGGRLDRNELAFEMARTAPGRYYFPFDPLANLMAEGRMFHVEDGVYSRCLADLPPSQHQIDSGLPPESRIIIYPQGAPRFLMTLIGRRFTRHDDWPWVVFTPATSEPGARDGTPRQDGAKNTGDSTVPSASIEPDLLMAREPTPSE